MLVLFLIYQFIVLYKKTLVASDRPFISHNKAIAPNQNQQQRSPIISQQQSDAPNQYQQKAIAPSPPQNKAIASSQFMETLTAKCSERDVLTTVCGVTPKRLAS